MLRHSSPGPYQKGLQKFDRGRGHNKQTSCTNNAVPCFDDFKFHQSLDKPRLQHDSDKPSSSLPLHAFQVKTAEPDQSWPAQPTKNDANMTESNLYAMFHEVQDALMVLCHSVEGLGNDVHSLQDEVGEVHDALDYVSNRFSEVTEDDQDAARMNEPTVAQAEVIGLQPDGYANTNPERYRFSSSQIPHTANGTNDLEDGFYPRHTGSCPLNSIGVDTRSLVNSGQLCPFGYTPSSQSPMGFQVQPAFNYSPNSSSESSPTIWNTAQSQSWTATQFTSYQTSSANAIQTQQYQSQTQAAATAVPSWLTPVHIPAHASSPINARTFAQFQAGGRASSRAPSRRGSQCTSMQPQSVKRAKTAPHEQPMFPPPQPHSRTSSPERWHKSRRMGAMAYVNDFAG